MSERNWETPLTSNTLEQRYEIIQQLAKKAGRRTLLARDRKTEELVVVKLLSFASDFEWDALKLFEREAKILQAISHPAIPRYLDYYELDFNNGNKGFALVQTYISGKSLEDYLKSGRSFDEVEIQQLAKAVLEI
ncbi:MAG: protein kinase domain-containing protein, partial [Chroococcidiopsis sp.]